LVQWIVSLNTTVLAFELTYKISVFARLVRLDKHQSLRKL
jgi:hypothetical protein